MVEITEANAREAAAAAERLLGDRFLAETLDEMVAIETQRAITLPEPRDRETARHQVIAIMTLRANLAAVLENWRAAAAMLRAQRAHE